MVRTGVPVKVRLGVWTARAWNVPIACAHHETKRKSLTVWRTRRAAPCGGAEPRCDAMQWPRRARSGLRAQFAVLGRYSGDELGHIS